MPSPAIVPLETVPSLDALDEAIKAGLPAESGRWECAVANDDFYRLRNAGYLERREAEDDVDFLSRPKRTSKLTRRVIKVLTDQLYNPGPTRTMPGPAGVFLDGVYRDTHVNNVMQKADRAATLNDVAAVQVEATGDPKRPIRVHLWKAQEFAVFTTDAEPCTPWAVVTRSIQTLPDGRRRRKYRVWSAAELRTYHTDAFTGPETAGGTRADRDVTIEPNPYPGCLPFTFVRNEPADGECEFWTGGLGTALRECNAEIDRELSDLAQHVKEFLNPRGFARNVSASSRFLERVGGFTRLSPTAAAAQGENTLQPDVFYLQARLAVEEAWANLTRYADMTLEELDIPAATVRADASTNLSGVAIIAKQVPLINRTRSRHVPFAETEVELAGKVLAVAGLWYGRADLVAAANDPKLTCVWPEPQLSLPTPEQDAADEAELALGLTDPLELLARRRGVTIAQAQEMAAEIHRRRQAWDAIVGPPEPVLTPQATPPPPRNVDQTVE